MKNEIVIVNAQDKLFIEKLKYSLEKSGFIITEDYNDVSNEMITMVFERKNNVKS